MNEETYTKNTNNYHKYNSEWRKEVAEKTQSTQ